MQLSNKLSQMQKLQYILLNDLKQLQHRKRYPIKTEIQQQTQNTAKINKSNSSYLRNKMLVQNVLKMNQKIQNQKQSHDNTPNKNQAKISNRNSIKINRPNTNPTINNIININNIMPKHKSMVGTTAQNQKKQTNNQLNKQLNFDEDQDLDLFNDVDNRFVQEKQNIQDKNTFQTKISISKLLKMQKQTSRKNNKIKISNISQNISQHNSQHNSLECTFKPSILKKSLQMAQKMENSAIRLNKSKNYKQNYQPYKQPTTKRYSIERINNLSKPRIKTNIIITPKQDQQQCTFKPKLSRKSLNQFNDCYLDVIGRNQLWQQQKQSKIKKLRQQEQRQRTQRQIKQRSIVFSTNQYKPEKDISISRFTKQGLISYFQRINHANELKQKQKQMQLKISGRLNQVSRSRSIRVTNTEDQKKKKVSSTGTKNTVQKEYEKAIKQLHEKILNLDL